MHEGRGSRHDLPIDVVQREHGEHAVALGERMRLRHEAATGDHVALRQHDALGNAGGAGRVHHQRIIGGAAGREVVAPVRNVGDELLAVGIDGDELDRATRACRGGGEALALAGRDEHQPRVAVREHVVELRGLREQVERRDHAPRVKIIQPERPWVHARGPVPAVVSDRSGALDRNSTDI